MTLKEFSVAALLVFVCGCFQPAVECDQTGSNCSDDPAQVDAGARDAGSRDAGSRDAGSIDAGSIDAGEMDAGGTDAGGTDAGFPDAGRTGPVGTYDVTFVCTFACNGTTIHTMTITLSNPATGAFSGTGVYNANASYTWNVSGTISAPNLFFTLVYTGTNPGYTCNMFGTVDASGVPLSGTGTSSEGQTFSWAAVRRP